MFLLNFHPDPILFQAGPIQIHWYGFLIALGLVINFFIAKYLFKKYKLSLELLYDLFFYLTVFGVMGARIWHVLSQISYYSNYPLEILQIWKGGLAIHGAVLGGAITLWIYSRKQKLSFLFLLDLFAPLIVLGQSIGRWGNYFNQELYGKPVEWGIPIDFLNRTPGYSEYQFFHPTFLYESIWCLLLFIFLIFLHHRQRLAPGLIFLLYLILYSFERFFISFLRLDEMVTWLGLRLDQWTSLILIITSIILIFSFKYKKCYNKNSL